MLSRVFASISSVYLPMAEKYFFFSICSISFWILTWFYCSRIFWYRTNHCCSSSLAAVSFSCLTRISMWSFFYSTRSTSSLSFSISFLWMIVASCLALRLSQIVSNSLACLCWETCASCYCSALLFSDSIVLTTVFNRLDRWMSYPRILSDFNDNDPKRKHLLKWSISTKKEWLFFHVERTMPFSTSSKKRPNWDGMVGRQEVVE